VNKRLYFFLLLLLCLAAALPAGGKKEKANTVQVTGVVRLVGSDPFPEMVISGPDREWYIAGEDRRLFADLQHRTVTVTGVETVQELKFANGYPAGERRTLANIKIIAVL
jgi:hypothetical protein